MIYIHSIMEALINFIGKLLKKQPVQPKAKRQLWWVDNKMGGYDGYELEPSGKLILLNWDLFRGVRWQMTEKGLYTEIQYKKNGNVLKETAEVVLLTNDRMELKTVTSDNEFNHTYIKIAYGTIADKYYGHYTNGATYVQVIPTNEYHFQVVFSDEKEEVTKYFGYLDVPSQALLFEMYGKDYALQHSVNGALEELTVLGKKYFRPVML